MLSKTALMMLPCFAAEALGTTLFLWVKSVLPPTGILDVAAAGVGLSVSDSSHVEDLQKKIHETIDWCLAEHDVANAKAARIALDIHGDSYDFDPTGRHGEPSAAPRRRRALRRSRHRSGRFVERGLDLVPSSESMGYQGLRPELASI